MIIILTIITNKIVGNILNAKPTSRIETSISKLFNDIY